MNNKKKGIWFIAGPFLGWITGLLLNFITDFIFSNFGVNENIAYIVGRICVGIGAISMIVLIPSIIYGIRLLNKKDENLAS